ncbi:uncharacterized protein LOC116295719 [Actinia tenebrosa]|uniref:Uncharacterized protein LOC116295719 n=1 Tax=Actinia tenebrosa TaxID=6105 RepID=A0A6P8I3K6_ACTTE|nr:uncharacterized protein LOC116295719 [Actinia tenebrosa]
MHWGIEYFTDPSDRQKKEASHLQSLGVQIIIGAHPHVLEGHTTNGTQLIAYSLGNALFAPKNKNKLFYCNREPSEETVKEFETYMASPEGLADPTTHSRIMRVQIDKKGLVGASYLPLRINFDPTSKCLQPTPTGPATNWIRVCSADDSACLN